MKKNQPNTVLKKICRALLLAGLIMVLIGLYYMVIKAGIPFQDAPPELQMRYERDMQTGGALVKYGFAVLVAGFAGRVVCRLRRH